MPTHTPFQLNARPGGVTMSFTSIITLRSLPYDIVMDGYSAQVLLQMPAATAADNANFCYLLFYRLAYV